VAPSRNLDSERPANWVVDYKTAFYGACGLLTVFAGLSWRLFSADITDHNTARAVTDQDQWVSIRTLERQVDGATRDVGAWEKQLAQLEARVRDLEHTGDRR
jgi:hypothetical protein